MIEDDDRLADVLVRGLRDAGHDVAHERNGIDGIRVGTSGEYDALVVDWMLPGEDGPSVCRALRARGVGTPILMLTARHSVPDRVVGLDAGADDYLTKPFAFDELLARLRVFARRTGRQGLLRVGDVVIDHERRSVTRNGVAIELTVREFDLLVALADRAGTIVTRLQILEDVWDGETDLRSNAIDVHVAKLRAKIDRPFGRETIQTVRGVGFRFADEMAD